MSSPGSDLPPAYYSLKEEKEEATTEQNAAEITIPDSDDAPEIYGVSFENKANRVGFIQKVLAIKFLQVLSVTLIMVIFVACSYEIWRSMRYDNTRIHLIVVSTLALLSTLGLIHYCDQARFIKPYNFMFLLAYPGSFGLFISVVTFDWALNEFFISWVHFNFVMFALLIYSLFAFQTKIEFKISVGLFITAGILIVAYALTVPFVYGISAFGVLYFSLTMFLLSAYVLNDLQAMMSKTYRIHLSPCDFVKAALIMHIDYRYMVMKFYKKHAQPHLIRNADPLDNAA